MEAGIVLKALGISRQECLDMRCEDSDIVLNVQTPASELRCPVCESRDIVRDGYVTRRFASVPIGRARTWIGMRVQRVKCGSCGAERREKVDFAEGKRRHTAAFADMVIDLSRFGTIQDVAKFLGVSWDVVRNIQMDFMQRRYAHPDISRLRRISIDEFAVHKGQKYKTIVLDLDTGRVVYAGDGNGKASLDGFWTALGDSADRIEAVCTDLSAAFTDTVLDHLPKAKLVVDHFHVVKLMNARLDDVRRKLWNEEVDRKARKAVKGLRWLLLRNGKDLYDEEFKTRLDNALALNKPLMIAYYLKESLGEIWRQPDKAAAERVLLDWVAQALDSKIMPVIKMARTVQAYRPFILNWYDFPISNGRIEGVNNKIKVLKRQMFGFRNDEYFSLRLFALHDKHLRI